MSFAKTMPWGKYRGQRISAVPLGYLGWVMEEATADPHLLDAIRNEIARRLGLRAGPTVRAYGPCSACEALRDRWPKFYRRAALAMHPDRSGDGEGMQLLNALNDEFAASVR